jgi:DnaJ-class molecular chaperone
MIKKYIKYKVCGICQGAGYRNIIEDSRISSATAVMYSETCKICGGKGFMEGGVIYLKEAGSL